MLTGSPDTCMPLPRHLLPLPAEQAPPLQHLSCTVQGPSFQHVLLCDLKHMYIIQQVAHRPPLLTPARQA